MQNKVWSTAWYTAGAGAVVGALNAGLHSLGTSKPQRAAQVECANEKAHAIEGYDVDAVLGVYQVVKLLYFGAQHV